jgi:hypothetical protein
MATSSYTWLYSKSVGCLPTSKPGPTLKDGLYQYGVGFLESKEGGDDPPLETFAQVNDLMHLNFLLDFCTTKVKYGTSSMHYRGSWIRFLSEEQLILSFCTDGRTTWEGVHTQQGQATLREARSFVRDVGRNHSSNMLTSTSSPWPIQLGTLRTTIAAFPASHDLLPVRVAATQYLKELIEAGYYMADCFPGINYTYENAGTTPAEGTMGPTGGVFQKNPMFYPLALVGKILEKSPDLIQVEVDISNAPPSASNGLTTASRSYPLHHQQSQCPNGPSLL